MVKKRIDGGRFRFATANVIEIVVAALETVYAGWITRAVSVDVLKGVLLAHEREGGDVLVKINIGPTLITLVYLQYRLILMKRK